MELITHNEVWFGIIPPIWDDEDFEDEEFSLSVKVVKKRKGLRIRKPSKNPRDFWTLS